jgi:hypothetical protein
MLRRFAATLGLGLGGAHAQSDTDTIKEFRVGIFVSKRIRTRLIVGR